MEALAFCQAAAPPGSSILVSDNEPDIRVRASMPKRSAGSARAENVTSRAAPIPSNGEPVSSAAAATKNRASENTPTKRIMSPVNERTAGRPPRGSRSAATTGATTDRTGPARNTHVVVRLTTKPFRRSFARSK